MPEGALLRKPGLGQSNRVVTYHSDTENDAEFREMSEWSRAEVLIRARKILAAHLGWFDDTGHPTQADSALITDEVTGRITAKHGRWL